MCMWPSWSTNRELRGTTPWWVTTTHWLVPITKSTIHHLSSQGEIPLGESRQVNDLGDADPLEWRQAMSASKIAPTHPKRICSLQRTSKAVFPAVRVRNVVWSHWAMLTLWSGTRPFPLLQEALPRLPKVLAATLYLRLSFSPGAISNSYPAAVSKATLWRK